MPEVQLTSLLRWVKYVYTGIQMKWWAHWKSSSLPYCGRSWTGCLYHRQPSESRSIQKGAQTSFVVNTVGCTRLLSKLWDDQHSPTLKEKSKEMRDTRIHFLKHSKKKQNKNHQNPIARAEFAFGLQSKTWSEATVKHSSLFEVVMENKKIGSI